MNVFVVYPNARAGWELLREGDASPLHFLAKDAAIGYARCSPRRTVQRAQGRDRLRSESRRAGSSTAPGRR
jgi:hypothetical protein